MKFCPECDNLLYAKDKHTLYCRVCKKEFEISSDENPDLKMSKRRSHEVDDLSPIIFKHGFNTEKITFSDRKAFEDYFGSSRDY